jgi:NADH pyrophosphatase NudC (nudix superfamily)
MEFNKCIERGQEPNDIMSIECNGCVITFDELLSKYGPERLYQIANKLMNIADDDVALALQQCETPVSEDDKDPYCAECGNDDLLYLDQYANGAEYKCKKCNNVFIY